MTAEERYDIECQIDALYNEADYCDDHNNPSRAVQCRYEANELRKKLDTDDTNECFSEDVDPFNVDWNDDTFAKRRRARKLIKEEVCNFRVSFNKKPDDFKDFTSEEEAIKFAKENRKDEPIVFKKCGDEEPVQIASYQDWEYGVREELEADAKELDEASSAFKKAVKNGGEDFADLQDGKAIAAVKDPDERARLVATKKLEKSGKLGNRPTVAQELKRKEDQFVPNYEKKAAKFIDAVAKMAEDYTGNPEERTDHLDYVDDNPTDDKFKFPKNITKKEDDHCKKSNPVVNHDPDDKDVLNEAFLDGAQPTDDQFVFTPEEQEEYDCDEGGYCDQTGDKFCHCAWCEDIYNLDDMTREYDFGYLCDNCIDYLRSRGEKLILIDESLKKDTKDSLTESLAGFSFEKGDTVVDKYEAWADVYVKAQNGGEILINIEGPLPDEVDDCFYLDISGGWSKYDNRDVGLENDWEFECNGVYVDPGPIDKALNCFDAKLQKLENDDPVDITVAEACQILQVSPDTLAVIIADAKKEVLQQFMDGYEDYIYDNVCDFVEYDPDDYD